MIIMLINKGIINVNQKIKLFIDNKKDRCKNKHYEWSDNMKKTLLLLIITIISVFPLLTKAETEITDYEINYASVEENNIESIVTDENSIIELSNDNAFSITYLINDIEYQINSNINIEEKLNIPENSSVKNVLIDNEKYTNYDNEFLYLDYYYLNNLSVGFHSIVIVAYDEVNNIQYSSENILNIIEDSSVELLNNLKEILQDPYELLITEDKINTSVDGKYKTIVEEEIENIVNDRLAENNIDIEELGYTIICSEDLYLNWDEDYNIYTGNIYIRNNNNNNTERLIINITFKNTNEHTEEEKNIYNDFIENNSLDFEQELSIGEYNNGLEILEDKLNELINDSNVEIRYYDIYGGVADYNIYWPYLFFINNKFYGVVRPTLTTYTKVDVPYEVENDYEYALNLLRTYYKNEEFIKNDEEIFLEGVKILYSENKYQIGILRINKLEGNNDYKYIEGANPEITIDEHVVIRVKINADYKKIVSVYLNDKELSKSYYTVKEGSTIIYIMSEYIDSLGPGTYKLEAKFTDGTAITNLTINKKETETIQVINTPIKTVRTKNYIKIEEPTETVEDEVVEEIDKLELLEVDKDKEKIIEKSDNNKKTKEKQKEEKKEQNDNNTPMNALFMIVSAIFLIAVIIFTRRKKEA